MKTRVPEEKRSHRPHRGRLELVIEVLEGIDLGLKKTNILYGVFTSNEGFDRYVGLAIKKGLLREIVRGRQKYWELTPKGKQFLYFGKELLKVWYTEPMEKEESLVWRFSIWMKSLLRR